MKLVKLQFVILWLAPLTSLKRIYICNVHSPCRITEIFVCRHDGKCSASFSFALLSAFRLFLFLALWLTNFMVFLFAFVRQLVRRWMVFIHRVAKDFLPFRLHGLWTEWMHRNLKRKEKAVLRLLSSTPAKKCEYMIYGKAKGNIYKRNEWLWL